MATSARKSVRRTPARRSQTGPRKNVRRDAPARTATKTTAGAAKPKAPRVLKRAQTGARTQTSARREKLGNIGRRAGRIGLRAGIVLGVVYGLMFGVEQVYDYATTSPRFEVKHLIYEPTAHVDDAHLRELLALEPGTNILALDLQELSERVVADAWVKEATVTREMPDTVEIDVVEHRASAVVLAGKFYLANEAGLLFKQAERGERGELPIITGIDRADLVDRREDVEAKVATAIDVLARYEAKHRPRLSEIHIGEGEELTLYTAQTGTRLSLGRGELEPKLARYDALRAALGERADRLSVVHLDASEGAGRKDRVVARFVHAEDEHAFLAESMDQHAPAEPLLQPSKQAAREEEAKKRGPKKKRIPKAY